jgi:16S rRNA (adenine1518-N6/adenine1519-N6)-dimethyltransferase
MTPIEIKSALQSLGGTANKHLGQHFLIDRATLEVMVNEAHTHPGMKTLEIGPGLGVLTKELIRNGHDVVALERDRRFIGWLENNVGAHGNAPSDPPVAGSLQVIPGDATTLDWDQCIGKDQWQLISNLPYSISSFVLRTALYMPHLPEQIVVLVQREVAERVRSVAGGESGRGRDKTSLLSLMVALASSETEILRRVPPGCFFPSPKVESAILRIVPRPHAERQKVLGIDPEKVMSVAKKGFAHPRKFLASNLGLTTEQRAALSGICIHEKARAEDLSPEQWVKLTMYLRVS